MTHPISIHIDIDLYLTYRSISSLVSSSSSSCVSWGDCS